MSQWLTEEDRKRIKQFAELPAYERTPEMLLPEKKEDER